MVEITKELVDEVVNLIGEYELHRDQVILYDQVLAMAPLDKEVMIWREGTLQKACSVAERLDEIWRSVGTQRWDRLVDSVDRPDLRTRD